MKYARKQIRRNDMQTNPMWINISDGKTCYEFDNIPEKLAKAIITLLNECANDETEIVASIQTDIDKEK